MLVLLHTSFVVLHVLFQRQFNVVLEDVYCCFTGTTLLTTLFTMITMVFFYKNFNVYRVVYMFV